jgi:glycosyltransferase involved in cell wall biosynthesis
MSIAPRLEVRPLTVLEPRVLPWHHWPGVHRLNTRRLLRAVRRALRDAGFAGRAPLIVTGSPPSVGVIEQLPAVGSIYFCMDDFLHHPSATARMIKPLEERLLRVVDATAATAESLTRLKRPASGVSRHIPQGVNYDHFATPRPRPADLANLPGPIIGFAGRLSACVDYELVRQVAMAFPEASVVLVGPVSMPEHVLQAIRLPNVHVLGPRPYDDLPPYVQSFDVALVPYVLNDWTRSVDPLKLLEYLAAGVPVVSTALPEVRRYAERVAIAHDVTAFVARIGEALHVDRAATRVANQTLARGHSWRVRAETLLELAEEVIDRRHRAVPVELAPRS